MELYIGLMSGTSLDGIDVALVNFEHNKPELLHTLYQPYSQTEKNELLALCITGENELLRLAQLDVRLGKKFAQAINQLLTQASIAPTKIQAIGSHGQTVRHYPEHGFTLQIGDPNVIAVETGITTIADFRRKDLALGGQGAPLVPAFHHYLFGQKEQPRAIVNIGGMSNVTFLQDEIIGFDIGPGNVLLDAWAMQHLKQPHDLNGAWANSGVIQNELLNALLNDPYFKLPAPKSTGREYFNLTWLNQTLANTTLSPVDVQSTLTELTAQTIVNVIKEKMSAGEILICGGGVHNSFLMHRIQELAKNLQVFSTAKYHVDPDWIEAMTFAWLARQTLHHAPGNIPKVTGAKEQAILGGIYFH